MVSALDFKEPEGSGTYLIDGDHRPIREAVEFVRRLLPEAQIDLNDDDLPLAPGATLNFEMKTDSSGATAAFGYRARHSMEAGVFKTINGNRIHAGLPALEEPPEAAVNPSSSVPRVHKLSLSPLTVLPCSPVEQIDAAHKAGFDSVGLRLFPSLPTDVDVMADRPLQRDIESAVLRTRSLRCWTSKWCGSGLAWTWLPSRRR